MSYTDLAGHWLRGRRFTVKIVDVPGHVFETTARVIGAWIRDGRPDLPVSLKPWRGDRRPIVIHLEIEGACPEGCVWVVPPTPMNPPRHRRRHRARMLPERA